MVNAGQTVKLIVMALLGLGVIFVHSAGTTVASYTDYSITAWLESRTVLYAVLALASMHITSHLNIGEIFRIRGFANPVFWLFLITVSLAVLTLVPGIGKTVNGASRWLYLGPRQWEVSFQPSELVKWTTILALAWWCTRYNGVMGRFRYGLAPALGLIAITCGLVIIEDLGTAVLIGVVSTGLLVAAGAKIWQIALIIPLAITALVGAILQSPYRSARLTAFLDPWADPMGTGYHPIQSMLAIAQGGLWGRGLGNGIQKFGYLPEDTTDFIFAVICEELGITGAILVIGLYLLLIWTGLAITRTCQDMFARLIILGVVFTVGLQALFNIAVVTVVIPTKGIALPLISAGGTGWILTAAAVGMIASLDKTNRLNELPSPP